MIGKADFADPKFSGFYQALANLKKAGLPFSDVASITFHAGPAAVPAEEGRDGLGHRRQRRGRGEGPRRGEGDGRRSHPVWGKGKLATSYDTTQSSVRLHHEVVEAPQAPRPSS